MSDALVSTIREVMAYSDWGREKVFAAAEGLSDEQLDRSLPMGWGSLREVLKHLYGAERLWYERLGFIEQGDFPRTKTLTTLDGLCGTYARLGVARDAHIPRFSTATLNQPVTFHDSQGRTMTDRRGDILLHVATHGVHHRAQALNMLRHAGRKPPGLDFLFMKLERPTVAQTADVAAHLRTAGFWVGDQPSSPPALSLATLRDLLAYGDWAFDRVVGAAAPLTDELLDRPFEMGLGTLRKTLLHIRDAEQWWTENWTGHPPPSFPKLGERTTIAELQNLYRESAARRDAHLAALTDKDLDGVIAAFVRPELELRFRRGESMLQLWSHGTHHRAQALNMLRHVGGDVPGLDFITMRRSLAPRAD